MGAAPLDPELEAFWGRLGFVVVQKPGGVVSLKELPADVQPQQVGSLTYFVSAGKHYMPYLDAAGNESEPLVCPVPPWGK